MMDEKTLELATQWLNDHKEHVRKIVEHSHVAVKPVGEDLRNPALWKAIHWNWFLMETKIDITPKKNRWSVFFETLFR